MMAENQYLLIPHFKILVISEVIHFVIIEKIGIGQMSKHILFNLLSNEPYNMIYESVAFAEMLS